MFIRSLLVMYLEATHYLPYTTTIKMSEDEIDLT